PGRPRGWGVTAPAGHPVRVAGGAVVLLRVRAGGTRADRGGDADRRRRRLGRRVGERDQGAGRTGRGAGAGGGGRDQLLEPDRRLHPPGAAGGLVSGGRDATRPRLARGGTTPMRLARGHPAPVRLRARPALAGVNESAGESGSPPAAGPD